MILGELKLRTYFDLRVTWRGDGLDNLHDRVQEAVQRGEPKPALGDTLLGMGLSKTDVAFLLN